MNPSGQATSPKAAQPSATRNRPAKHPLVRAIRVPLTDHLNERLWELCLISGLEKQDVASLALDKLENAKEEVEFTKDGALSPLSEESTSRQPRRSDPNPRARHIDVRVDEETLRKLKDWAKGAGISVGEVAAFIVREATPESVASAKVALELLTAVNPESVEGKCA